MNTPTRCPACQSPLPADLPRDGHAHAGVCPACQHRWSFGGASPSASSATGAETDFGGELPTRKPKLVRPKAPAATSLATASAAPSLAPAASPAASSVASPVAGVAGPRAAIEPKLVRPSGPDPSGPSPAPLDLAEFRAAADRRSILLLGSLLGIAIGLAGFLAWRLTTPTPAAAEKSAPPVVDAPGETPAAATAPILVSSPPAAAGPAPAAARPGDELARLRQLPNDEYLKLWSSLYPYLVELEVETGSETRRVPGVIVDSRGWVLTALTPLRGAEVIRVRDAAKTFNAATATGELVDECRGVLDVEPSRDLVLLEINRRLVTAFANIAFATEDSPVGGESLIGAVPPPAAEKIWMFDCAIRQVASREKLPEPIQARLPAAPDSATAPLWMLCSGPAPRLAPGAPLFTPAGRLAGLLIGGSTPEDGLALGGASLAEFCRREHGPLRTLAQGLRADPAAAAEPAVAAADPAEPLAPRLAAVAARAAAVEQAGMFQDRPGVYQAWLQLAQELSAVDESFATLPADDEQPRDLARLLDRFQKSVLEAWGIGQFTIEKFNQQAWEQSAADGAPLVAVASVFQAGLTAPKINGADTVIFQLEPSGQYLITPVAQHIEIFLPGSRWLIFGVSRAAAQDYQGSKPTPYSARRCKITRVFALSDSE